MRTDSLCGIGSLHKRKKLNRTDSVSFEKKNNVGVKMNIIPATAQSQRVKSCLPESTTSSGRYFPYSDGGHVLGQHFVALGRKGTSQIQVVLTRRIFPNLKKFFLTMIDIHWHLFQI